MAVDASSCAASSVREAYLGGLGLRAPANTDRGYVALNISRDLFSCGLDRCVRPDVSTHARKLSPTALQLLDSARSAAGRQTSRCKTPDRLVQQAHRDFQERVRCTVSDLGAFDAETCAQLVAPRNSFRAGVKLTPPSLGAELGSSASHCGGTNTLGGKCGSKISHATTPSWRSRSFPPVCPATGSAEATSKRTRLRLPPLPDEARWLGVLGKRGQPPTEVAHLREIDEDVCEANALLVESFLNVKRRTSEPSGRVPSDAPSSAGSDTCSGSLRRRLPVSLHTPRQNSCRLSVLLEGGNERKSFHGCSTMIA